MTWSITATGSKSEVLAKIDEAEGEPCAEPEQRERATRFAREEIEESEGTTVSLSASGHGAQVTVTVSSWTPEAFFKAPTK